MVGFQHPSLFQFTHPHAFDPSVLQLQHVAMQGGNEACRAIRNLFQMDGLEYLKDVGPRELVHPEHHNFGTLISLSYIID